MIIIVSIIINSIFTFIFINSKINIWSQPQCSKLL